VQRKTQMAREIEIKLRVKDVQQLRVALKRMGARLARARTARVHEWNTVFDTASQDLRRREQLLRIRLEAPEGHSLRRAKNAARPALLTFKQPTRETQALAGKRPQQGRHKVREEIELRIGDAAALARIFEALNLRASVYYEKYRTTFRLPTSSRWATGLLIELDETPIGNFVELEGPPRAIDRAARALGFSKKDYILKNYLRLNAEDRLRRGVEPGDMVFPARK
jgi:adenylate cyclase class 2